MSVTSCHENKSSTKVNPTKIKNTLQDLPARDVQQECPITKVLGELNATITEKEKLENYDSLVQEILNLKKKNKSYENLLEKNGMIYQSDLKKLADDVKDKEEKLLNCCKSNLEEQNKYFQEITKFKIENDKLRESFEKREIMYLKKIANLEKQLAIHEGNFNVFKAQSEEHIGKTNKYKGKLKYAVGIINELNTLLMKCIVKPDISHSMTQTVYQSNSNILNISIDLNGSQILENDTASNDAENLLLAELFFRTRSFCDSELQILQNSGLLKNL